MPGQVPRDGSDPPCVQRIDEAPEPHRVDDVYRRPVVRGLDPHGLDAASGHALRRAVRRRVDRAVVDVHPGPEPTEDRCVCALRGGRGSCAYRADRRGDDCACENPKHAETVRPTHEDDVKAGLESRERGRSSVGRALASQARCRGFESHRPLRIHAGLRHAPLPVCPISAPNPRSCVTHEDPPAGTEHPAATLLANSSHRPGRVEPISVEGVPKEEADSAPRGASVDGSAERAATNARCLGHGAMQREDAGASAKRPVPPVMV